MNGLWTFSASNQALLQQLIDNAPPAEENNEWAKTFNIKHYGTSLLQKTDDDCLEVHQNTIQNMPMNGTDDHDMTSSAYDDNEKNLCEVVENDLVANVPLIVAECTKNPSLFAVIAKNVPTASIEKFCHQVTTTEVNEKFVIGYLETFLPAFLMIQSSFALELLFEASNVYPQLFRMHFLPVILKNTQIPNSILHGFIQSLQSKEKIILLETLCRVNLKTEEFQYHLLSIYTLYKDCEATSFINSFIYSNIREFSEHCVHEKNFGRLLLAFIQSVTPNDVDVTELENIIENHRSAFRKPCMNKFDSIFKSQ